MAVRSSATLEDSAEASFAGLQDTYLAVRGTDAVLDRVRACWASLYNDESVAYRRRQGIGEDGLAMAVVVQRMLYPRSAGVMFTRSPVTGDRSVVAIEGDLGPGLGPGGRRGDAGQLHGEQGDRRDHGGGSASSCGSIHSRRTARGSPPRRWLSRCGGPLPDRRRGPRARPIGRQVEDHYGAPQDIEWALLGDAPARLHADLADRIVLLQSRPETVWAARDRAPIASPRAKASDHVLARFRRAL